MISLRALVVYESMYGNTHVVASNVADGLRATHEVTLVPVAEATEDLVAEADLLVVGGPTHMHGLSSPATRRMAAQAAAKPASGLSLDPDACGPGLRDWLKGLGPGIGTAHALVAVFDTRLNGVAAWRPPQLSPPLPRGSPGSRRAPWRPCRRPAPSTR